MNRLKSPKLSKDECEELRELKRWIRNDMRGEVFWFPEHGVTVAVCPAVHSETPEFLHVAWAIQADHEPKFRRKLGALTALTRLQSGQFLPMRSWMEEMDSVQEALESAATNVADMV